MNAERVPKLAQHVFLTTVTVGAATLLTCMTLVIWLTGEMNARAAETDLARMDAQLQKNAERLGIIVADYAHWDTSFEAYQAGDDAALYDLMGSGAADSDTFDFLYMMLADGTVTHAYSTGIYESDRSLASPELAFALAEELRGSPIEDYLIVNTFGNVGADIVQVSATRLQPDDFAALTADNLPILVGGLALDTDYLAGLSDQTGISGIALTLANNAPQDGHSELILRGLGDAATAAVSWANANPGTALLRQVLPTIAAMFFLVLAGVWIVARSIRSQTQAFLDEHANARTDGLTGLSNRLALNDIVNSEKVENAIRQDGLALLYVDIDKFKSINDIHGHDVGDAVLIAVARRLRHAVRTEDQIFRLGGDEFLCLIFDQSPAEAAKRLGERIVALNDNPIAYNGASYPITLSIGLANAENQSNWASVLKGADSAMYEAKRNETSSLVAFSAA